MSTYPRSINQLLRLGHTGQRSLRNRLDRHRELRHAIMRQLPTFLAEHCHDVVARDDQLIVYTDSPAWASRLKYYALSISERIRITQMPELKNIRIRVYPRALPEERRKRRPKLPSETALAGLRAAAGDTSQEELRDALLKLAKTMQEKSGSD